MDHERSSSAATPTRLLWVALAILAMPAAIQAQSVAIGSDRVEIFDTDGDSALRIDSAADLTAGGNGRTASLFLNGFDGPTTLSYNAFQAQLILGGGDHEGILSIRDDDGVTTTIDLDGRIGRLLLGANGEDGDLIVNDGSGAETLRMNGAGGTITNIVSGNGLVKAWARVDADGTLNDCWRCDSVSGGGSGNGVYSVTFTQSVGDRPRSATIDYHSGGVAFFGFIRTSSPNATTVNVRTADVDGGQADRPFTLVIY